MTTSLLAALLEYIYSNYNLEYIYSNYNYILEENEYSIIYFR